jgi:NAD(P)H-hydrate epimerase
MRALDQKAITKFGITAELLMENAGHAAYYALRKAFDLPEKRCLVFCGVGNNGGDGCVLARKIHADGGLVKVYVIGDPDRFKGAAKLNYDIITRLPIEIQMLESVDGLSKDIAQHDLIVDAILGTGLSRDVGGLHRKAIGLINESRKPVLSIDIPSGVHGDTGLVMGDAVKANYTVTFGLPKIGNLLQPGRELGGKLYLSHISFSPSIYENNALAIEINRSPELPPRDILEPGDSPTNVLYITGPPKHPGEAILGPISILKAGCQHLHVATPSTLALRIPEEAGEIALIPLTETASGGLALNNLAGLLDLSEKIDLVVLGSGLSTANESQGLVQALVEEIHKPLIIDSGGFTALSEDYQLLKNREEDTVLILNIDDLVHFIGKEIDEVALYKIDFLQQISSEINAAIILNDVVTIIGYPDQRIFINLCGGCRLDRSETSAVLTGTVASMYAHGFSLWDAVRQGVFVHGLAVDLAAIDHSEEGFTALDVLDRLPHVVNHIRDGVDKELLTRCAGVEII